MASDVMIEARGLSKRYGAVRALDKVSFDVKRGEVVGFLGPNGAGKSTTMRILTCYLSASAGSVRVHGHDVFDEPLEVRRKVGYLPQRAQMYGEMSVWEYLQFVAELRKIEPSRFRKRMKTVVEICGLSSVLGMDIRTLSHGYRQRVGLGQALIHDPPILILDEPTSDLDPNEKTEVINYIREIGVDRTVVLSTHNLAEVEAACARAIIVSKGRVVADGSIDEVRARGGRQRYRIVIDEQRVLNGGQPPKAQQVADALGSLEGVTRCEETPTDETAHAFSLLGVKSIDLRPDLYRLCVDKGWLLLEIRRDVQKLEDVFKSLTMGDALVSRGRAPAAEELDDDEDDAIEEEDSLDDEDSADEAPSSDAGGDEADEPVGAETDDDEDDHDDDHEDDEDDEDED